MRSADGFQHALDLAATPALGLDFYVGSWSEMAPESASGDPTPGAEAKVVEHVRRFGPRISYVHFRDVVGQVPRFREGFVDEGNCDMFAVMHADAE